MTKEKAAEIVKDRIARCRDSIDVVKRKRSWRPVEKAMTIASFTAEKEAMSMAYAALMGKELVE